MDEARVEAERHVVEEEPPVGTAYVDPALDALESLQCSLRVVAVQPHVAGEMVSRAERDADERQVALDRDLGDRGEGPVSAGHPEHVGAGRAREVRRALSLPEHVGPDSALLSGGGELAGVGRAAPGTRVDEEEARHSGTETTGTGGLTNEPFGPWHPAPLGPIFMAVSERGLHLIEDDLSDTWLEDWAGAGVAEIESLLAKHAAFLNFLEAEDS
jgi:hypothetical protein